MGKLVGVYPYELSAREILRARQLQSPGDVEVQIALLRRRYVVLRNQEESGEWGEEQENKVRQLIDDLDELQRELRELQRKMKEDS